MVAQESHWLHDDILARSARGEQSVCLRQLGQSTDRRTCPGSERQRYQLSGVKTIHALRHQCCRALCFNRIRIGALSVLRRCRVGWLTVSGSSCRGRCAP